MKPYSAILRLRAQTGAVLLEPVTARASSSFLMRFFLALPSVNADASSCVVDACAHALQQMRAIETSLGSAPGTPHCK